MPRWWVGSHLMPIAAAHTLPRANVRYSRNKGYMEWSTHKWLYCAKMVTYTSIAMSPSPSSVLASPLATELINSLRTSGEICGCGCARATSSSASF